jgi:hypothetical protein
MDFSEWTVTKGAGESASHTGRSRLQAVATAQCGSSLFLYRRASSLQRVRRRLAGEMAVAAQPATPIGASAAVTLRMPFHSVPKRLRRIDLPPAELHAPDKRPCTASRGGRTRYQGSLLNAVVLQRDQGIRRRSHTLCIATPRNMRLTFARSTLESYFAASQQRFQLCDSPFVIAFDGLPDIRHFTLRR